MKLEPIIKAKLSKFKDTYDCTLSEDLAFERFANWTIFQRHQPGIFTADPDMLDAICVGGSKDMGIDGLCIKVNGILVKSIHEVRNIVSMHSKIEIEYIFVQTKNKSNFKQSDYGQFLTGIKDFLGEKIYQPYNEKIADWIKIKEYLMDEDCCAKWIKNPTIYVYYIFLGDGEGGQYIRASEQRFRDEIKKLNTYGDIQIENIDSEKLKKYCDENENNYEARLSILESCSFLGENEHIAEVGSNSTVAICRASELIKLLTTDDGLLRKGIFDDNVRDYQGETSINNEIFATIKESPDDFVLYNNGITIVCQELTTNGKNLIIKNPQIVNGCQTCNVIYNSQKLPNSGKLLSSVKVILKIISTSNNEKINKVVRGTNKQNIVQDEAFETIREFHKNLEDFFLAANTHYAMPYPLYYERRSRQYDNMGIKEISKIKFSMLIRGFVSIFLAEPHRSVNHPATLQKDYKDKIFIDRQSLLPYYASAQICAFVEMENRAGVIPDNVKSFKMHVAYVFCLLSAGFLPNINISKYADTYSEKILDTIKDTKLAKANLLKAIDIFCKARAKWIDEKGDEYKYGIKDRPDFTAMLNGFVRDQIKDKCNETMDLRHRGQVAYVGKNWRGQWFGFISTIDGDRIYFNSAETKDFPSLLYKDVLYDLTNGAIGKKAVNICVIE